MALSGNFLLLPPQIGPPDAIKSVPDLSLNVTVGETNAGLIVSTDGGVQLLSNSASQYAIVDVILSVDIPATPTTAAVTKELARRRVFAGNVAALQTNVGVPQTVTNWSFSVIDVQPAGPYTYKVSAQLVANSGPNAVVSGSSTTLPWLRGTLTAVAVNK